ncbi:MAG: 5'-methylthioadenosine/S-adenosylhomocysteine nucleosidase, partial [Clostridiales bacterium]|nr:5'-methylthioadenosine/S-adenosylhomocysteine nucleosidase [Clostridiales bacterium]
EEIAFLKDAIAVKKHERLNAGRSVYTVESGGKTFLLAVSGIGKVNSAATLQYILDKYGADSVINIGTAGGFSGCFEKNAVMLPVAAYQHDYDLGVVGGDGYKRGGVPNVGDGEFRFDAELVAALTDVCRGLGYKFGGGILVSGDQFISDPIKVDELKRGFGAAACDMEGGALLQAAALNGFKRLAAVKSISDGADEYAAKDFSDITSSKEKIKNIILKYLSKQDNIRG